MADTVLARKLRDSNGRYAFLLGNASDGTGESNVQKVDISGLDGAPTRVKIVAIKWACEGLQVKLSFDHDTDDVVALLAAHGDLNEDDEAPLVDPASAGGTGDLLLTTVGQTAGDGYTIYLELEKIA